ncbi:CGNR zinc finger domain-containing protein [Streptomyces botrytidirepellens]|uniref:Zf-CGNR multi-domain protein n=1 Tax=Streptomyces botrytidirepellens TaxID=2486417 RepID=A0A3M8VMX6_9ACTN|nr:ABATE domain-containing protein [Streptomyces botrytidirepellens]RNG17785.1 zf-CGNR multi-domain protein [Streptomyces botrytidirepellens]
MTGSPTAAGGFRLGNEILAFRFVATLSERRGDAAVERIPTPDRLRAWLLANELGSADMPISDALLRDARELREAIHRAGTAVATDGVPDPADEDLLNRWTARHRARLVLTGGRARWRLPDSDPARAALAVVAVDAVATLGAHHNDGEGNGHGSHGDGVIKRCEQRTCGGLFLDTSRGRRRRWCSMATCGNKVKKANLKSHLNSHRANE